MIELNALRELNPLVWEIPKEFRSDMRVPGRVYASRKMLEEISRDRSLDQLVNVATLPGIEEYALAMPDAHEGYGFPVGGVAAFREADGIISPGGIGYDINCGVRLLRSERVFSEVQEFLPALGAALYREIPSGVGRGGRLRLKGEDFRRILEHGAQRLVEEGYGVAEDLAQCESEGRLSEADAAAVGETAKKRGSDQLGTMGAGNHFVEVEVVESVFDDSEAARLGLFADQVVVMIHTGSRGLGHQVATDYIRLMVQALPRFGIVLPDRELACAPFSSPEGEQYFRAMCGAANFAWANRQLVSWEVRKAWEEVLGVSGGTLQLVYDVAHNIAKIEEGRIVHRKGATRAFPGQPVLIPGSMGTGSYVLVGEEKALRESFGSSCHGAGRRMSRSAAKRKIRGSELREQLEQKGIVVETGSLSGLAEEAPEAYKDVDEVVEVIHRAGIARKVARLRPVAVVKG